MAGPVHFIYGVHGFVPISTINNNKSANIVSQRNEPNSDQCKGLTIYGTFYRDGSVTVTLTLTMQTFRDGSTEAFHDPSVMLQCKVFLDDFMGNEVRYTYLVLGTLKKYSIVRYHTAQGGSVPDSP